MPHHEHGAWNLVILNCVLDDGVDDGKAGCGMSAGKSALLAGHFSRCWGGEDKGYKAESANKLLHAVRIARVFDSDVD
jgi:hypothetical protein